MNTEENVTIKQVQNFNYLGVSLNKKCINQKTLLIKFVKEDK